MTRLVKAYDTTLRDGTQGEGIAFSLEDKVRITKRLDQMGIHYIEGGWPGSNPKDIRYFHAMREVPLKNARLVAFGSTRRPDTAVATDPNLRHLLEAKTKAITIHGKSWDFQVTDALKTTLDENLAMIRESVGYLKTHVEELIYDAEHFFDGFKRNPEYALASLRAAEEAGATCLVLCDTNGGSLPCDIARIFREVKKRTKLPLGIHAHNDSDCAVASTLTAVVEGADHFQGTFNGYGERCGNANLCSIIPNVMLKMGLECLPKASLGELREVSRFISELANKIPWTHQPYVGDSAFAHKGGLHVSAVAKDPGTYEHVDPALVGNRRRVLVSELSGQSNVLWKAQRAGIDLNKNNPDAKKILKTLKELEDQGFEFEGAEASFELLMEKAMDNHRPGFDLEGWRIVIEKRGKAAPVSEATIKLHVNGIAEHTAAEGHGPVSALDHALRKALEEFYPSIKGMSLLDYKVRILDQTHGTAAKTRVLITSGDTRDSWGTVGVSDNIIEASWQALVDSVEYKLRLDERRKKNGTSPAAAGQAP
jgi:2-isopropylmalate synthase